MKETRVISRFSGALLEGVDAKCYTALMNRREAERKIYDELHADIERKAAELKVAAELKAADEYTITAERKAAAAKYRAAAREKESKWKLDVEHQAAAIRRNLYEMSRIAAERKIDELLSEAIDEQNGQNGDLGAYLGALRSGLTGRLRMIGCY